MLQRFPALFLLFITAAWGLGFLLTKDALAALPPFSFVTIRFLIASVSFILFSKLFSADSLLPITKDEFYAGGFLGLLLFLGYGFQSYGIRLTTVSHTAFITGAAVVLIPLILSAFGHRTTRSAVIAISLSAVGTYLLSATESLLPNLGDALVFVCAIAIALHIIYVGKFAKKYSPVKLTLIQILTCTVLSFFSAVSFESFGLHSFQLSSGVWAELIFCGMVGTAFAFLVQTSAQKHLSSIRTALILTGEPVFGTLFAMIFAHEVLSGSQWFGASLMITGILICELAPAFAQHRHLFFSFRKARSLTKTSVAA